MQVMQHRYGKQTLPKNMRPRAPLRAEILEEILEKNLILYISASISVLLFQKVKDDIECILTMARPLETLNVMKKLLLEFLLWIPDCSHLWHQVPIGVWQAHQSVTNSAKNIFSPAPSPWIWLQNMTLNVNIYTTIPWHFYIRTTFYEVSQALVSSWEARVTWEGKNFPVGADLPDTKNRYPWYVTRYIA